MMSTAGTSEQGSGTGDGTTLTVRRHTRRRLAAIAAILGLLALLALAGAVVDTRSAQAPTRVPRVAYLDLARESDPPPDLPAFEDELRALGYEKGKTIAIDYRWGENDQERLRA